jgi:hypothetical protein
LEGVGGGNTHFRKDQNPIQIAAVFSLKTVAFSGKKSFPYLLRFAFLPKKIFCLKLK